MLWFVFGGIILLEGCWKVCFCVMRMVWCCINGMESTSFLIL